MYQPNGRQDVSGHVQVVIATAKIVVFLEDVVELGKFKPLFPV